MIDDGGGQGWVVQQGSKCTNNTHENPLQQLNNFETVADLFFQWIEVSLCPTESDNLSSTLSQSLGHRTTYTCVNKHELPIAEF